jgi:hypothetical protein
VSLCAALRLRSTVRFWSGQGKLVTSYVVRLVWLKVEALANTERI